MKKIFTLFIICSVLSFVKVNAQVSRLLIQDTTILKLFKKIANGDYSENIGVSPWNGTKPTCPTCFNGDTLITSNFYDYSLKDWNLQHLPIIDISNKGITDLEPFRYFGWGKDVGYGITTGFYNYGVQSFICDSNFISDISPIPINSKDFYRLSFKNNGISGDIIIDVVAPDYLPCSSMFGSACSYLDLSYNQIKTVKFGLGGLRYFGMLDLSHNMIDSIDFKNYYGRFLNISYNNLTTFNDTIHYTISGGLPHFIVSHNPNLKSMSAYFFGDDGVNLDFSYNPNLTTIRPSFYGFYPWGRGLGDLNFSHCNISTAQFDTWTNMGCTSLDLSYNNLSNQSQNGLWWSDSFYVNNLNLSHNKFTSYAVTRISQTPTVPIVHLTGFSSDLSRNQINNIVGDFTDTHVIKIDSNNLYCLPKLPSILTSLIFDTAKITCLPNVGSFTINGTANTIYPTCNVLNNAHQCQAFPTVTGGVFLDSNKNNIYDANEKWLAGIEITLQTSNGKIFKTFTNNNGYYNVSADTIGSYTITATPLPNTTATPQNIAGTFTVYDSVYLQNNIAIKFNTVISATNDMQVYSVKTWKSRPGFPFIITTVARNIGASTLNPVITLQFDSSKIDYVGNYCGASYTGGNTVITTYNNFVSGFQTNCRTALKLKPTAQINDTLAFYTTTVYITSATGTVTLTDTFYSVVTGSFDPNDKNATPQLSTSQVANGAYIDYAVQFQNTGNDTAFNIVVADTLSSLLQANSFQLIGSSHNCKTTINDNKVYFEFIDILLPDSNINYLGSNGFVKFKVKPINSVTAGTIIPNSASIYFDYNKPVLTNVANTKIVIPAVVTPLSITDYQLQLINDKRVNNEWQTANEVNVSHYNIERSENAKDFSVIGKIKANNKAENGYTFTDEKLPVTYNKLTLYYRITGVDNDGRKTYSQVKSIAINDKLEVIHIYPNPAKDFVNIECKEGIKSIKLFNSLGQEIVSLSHNNDKPETINIKQLTKGLYFVQITTAKGNVLSEKLIVE